MEKKFIHTSFGATPSAVEIYAALKQENDLSKKIGHEKAVGDVGVLDMLSLIQIMILLHTEVLNEEGVKVNSGLFMDSMFDDDYKKLHEIGLVMRPVDKWMVTKKGHALIYYIQQLTQIL